MSQRRQPDKINLNRASQVDKQGAFTAWTETKRKRAILKRVKPSPTHTLTFRVAQALTHNTHTHRCRQRVMARKVLRHLNACPKPQFMAADSLKGRQKGGRLIRSSSISRIVRGEYVFGRRRE